jgi:hypothetical protein
LSSSRWVWGNPQLIKAFVGIISAPHGKSIEQRSNLELFAWNEVVKSPSLIETDLDRRGARFGSTRHHPTFIQASERVGEIACIIVQQLLDRYHDR